MAYIHTSKPLFLLQLSLIYLMVYNTLFIEKEYECYKHFYFYININKLNVSFVTLVTLVFVTRLLSYCNF
jgi:hypothetical protein